MFRLMSATFLLLGLGFYVLSGGPNFVPEERVAPRNAAVAAAPAETLVTRASTRSADLVTPASLVAASAPAPELVETAARPVSAASAAPDQAADPEPEVFLFESLAEGAPRAADILPDSRVAVIAPDGAVVGAAVTPAAVAVSGDMRQVSGSRVNLRSGPGTSYGVLTTLSRGDGVEVFEVDADGWARLRSVATGQEGWMAERLLTGG